MKKLFYLSGLVITVVVIITACQKTSVTEENGEITLKANPNGPSAVGAGTFLYINPIGEENIRHFSFHAKTMPQGHVQGNGVLTYNSGVVNIQFDIDCLFSVDDKTAIMTGVITRHTLNPDRVGQDCWFKVVDNGEGSNYDPDEMTLLLQGYLNDCSYDYSLQLWEIEGGNIQVNP